MVAVGDGPMDKVVSAEVFLVSDFEREVVAAAAIDNPQVFGPKSNTDICLLYTSPSPRGRG